MLISDSELAADKFTSAVAAVVVWYLPSIDEIKNILTYLDEVDALYIVDNSPNNNVSLLSELNAIDKVTYLPQLENTGIASALNRGCRIAIQNGYQWVLTMDQDSKFSEYMAKRYIDNFLEKKEEQKDIALYAPVSNHDQKEGFHERVITSGNILSLPAYIQVEGFDDSLFIDEVDHDLCFKLLRHGLKIYVFGDVTMCHSLGNTRLHTFFFKKKKMWVMHHSALRKYYMMRNRLKIREIYPEYTSDYAEDNKRLILGVILFEDKKISKLVHMLRGFIDYKKGIFGPLR